jgi:UDP-glucose 4-epimerase
MKYLVTGGAGFIGSHIATALVERGDEVRVLDNLRTGSRLNLAHLSGDIELVEGDLLNAEEVERAVEDVEVIFHEAALASVPRSVAKPLDTHAVCVTGTLNVLEAARQAGARRVVFAGSSSVYGNKQAMSKREADVMAPLSPYAAAKMAGEAYCQSYTACFGLETVVLRYFNVFGPRQDPNGEYSAVIPKFVALMLRGKRPIVFGDGQQSRDFTYVEDVVRGNLLAADSVAAVGRVFNIACGRQQSLLELIESINGALGTSIEPVFEAARAGDVRESLADIAEARAVLGYEPAVSFDDGLQRSIDYYRAIA